jgi:hypothetical protein
MTLLSAPLQLGGDWGGSAPGDALAVIARMREVSLSGVRLLSDRQPAKLRVDDHATGPPHIWLHDDNPDTAWIVVNIGARDWCKLAYQFGHELGHVVCNSWWRDAKPRPPCQWLEEAMVEAFSLRGLGLLADSWAQRPPFPGDAAFAGAIRKYRQDLVENYTRPAGAPPVRDICAWLHRNRDALDHTGGVAPIEGPEIVQIVAALEGDPACVEDLGAVNRWPARSEVARRVPAPVAGELRGNPRARHVAGAVGAIAAPGLSDRHLPPPPPHPSPNVSRSQAGIRPGAPRSRQLADQRSR